MVLECGESATYRSPEFDKVFTPTVSLNGLNYFVGINDGPTQMIAPARHIFVARFPVVGTHTCDGQHYLLGCGSLVTHL